MKLLIIVGSNRLDGMSAAVVSLIRGHLAGRAKVDTLWLRDYRIELCDADNACAHRDCEVNDDVGKIVDAMQESDAILYLPVMHAYGLNSRFQAFLERVGYGFMRPRSRPLVDKLAAVAVVGRRYGHTTAFNQVVLNILLNKMILVGSGFPPIFQSQLQQDIEAERSLKDTLDRMLAHYQNLQEGLKTKSTRINLLKQIEMQTG